MWVRGKYAERQDGRGRWDRWDWLPLEWTGLMQIRNAVRIRFRGFVRTCIARGEVLTNPHHGIEVPLGFTPNDLVTSCVNDLRVGIVVDFINVRYFFQTIETAGGDYEAGPRPPYERFANVMAAPKEGWRHG